MEIWFGLTSNISLKGEGISTAEYLVCYVLDENWLHEHLSCSIGWAPLKILIINRLGKTKH